MTTLDVEEIAEQQAIVDALGVLESEHFATAGGAIPMGEGQMRNISDPMRLIRVYIAATGEPRDVPFWTVDGKNSILRRKVDGQRVFSVHPTQPWKGGEVPCILHPSHPNRERYNAMGLEGKVCPAAHLASLYSQRVHAMHRHKTEWETIQAYEQLERDEEQRAFIRLQTSLLLRQQEREDAAPARAAK